MILGPSDVLFALSKPKFRLALAALILLSLSGCSHIVTIAKCDDPRASIWQYVTLVALPYEYIGTNDNLTGAAKNLAFINQLQIVSSGLDYDNFGITTLVRAADSDTSCDPVEVEKKLFDPEREYSGPAMYRDYNDLIIWWGRIYEQSDSVYIQNNLRFVQHGQNPQLRHVKKVDGAEFTFVGSLPGRGLSFSPREVSPKILSQLRDIIETSGKVYHDHDRGSTVVHTLVPEELGVLELKKGGANRAPDGWVQIDVSGKKGWWQIGEYREEVKELFSELYFLDGTIGVLQYFHPQLSVGRMKIVENVERAFKDFAQRNGEPSQRSEVALGKLLTGYVQLARGEELRSDVWLTEAARMLEEAVVSMPSNSKVRTLRAMPSVIRCCTPDDGGVTREVAEEALLNAIIVDPTDETAFRNLEVFYKYLAALKHYEAKDLSAIQEFLRAFQRANQPKKVDQEVEP